MKVAFVFSSLVACLCVGCLFPNNEAAQRQEIEQQLKQRDAEVLMLLNQFEAMQNSQSGSLVAEGDRQAIMAVFAAQQQCWNSGNITCFMNGYWQSDSLLFIGSRGLTYGWQSTLDSYQVSYPNEAVMGELTFDILSMQSAGPNTAFVVGEWKLEREIGDVGGHFSLLWRKIDGQWLIVADHSS